MYSVTHPHTLSSLIAPLSIAPMVDWTYTHFRVLMRMLAPRALLYTDMQTPGAIFHNPARAIHHQPMEHPLALQLGGADIDALVRCAQIAEELGYCEVNLNLGCPSERVRSGRFGACLMADPVHVGACINAMKQAVCIPVSAKTRIGIDEQDSYDFFATFATMLVDAGCDKLIVHARKAWLNGLNPKQNRTIPPLHYEYVYKIKQALPSIPVVINGNINALADIHHHLAEVDGVMLGRLACQNPYAIAEIHQGLYPDIERPTRAAIVARYVAYAESMYTNTVSMSLLLKPIFNLAHGLPGARVWKEGLMKIQQSKNIADLVKVASLIADMECSSSLP